MLIASRKRDMRLVYKASIVFFLPFFGITLFVVLAVARKFAKKVDTEEILDLSGDVVFTSLGGVKRVDYENEVNIVPIDDALEVNSDTIKRRLIYDIFKEDALTYMSYLEKALNNADTETTHYAAAAVFDIQRKLMLSLQEFSVKYENDRGNLEVLLPYAEVLRQYLSSSLLDNKSRLKYKNTYSQVLEDILKLKQDKDYYMEKINCDLFLKNYDKAEVFTKKFLQDCPGIEEPYIMLLKYNYSRMDRAGFRGAMEALKKSDVRFSSSALGIVRYWGRAYEE